MIKNIYITGFMGAGKSRAGKLLAQKLSRDFLDTDTLIEKDTGLSINEIFNQHGEPHFRTLESNLISRLSKKSGLVLSLGGGAVLNQKTRQILSCGIWVFIDTPFDIIKKRILKKSHRPLAKNAQNIENLYNKRLSIYKQAPVIIKNSGDCEEICQSILKRITPL